MVLIFYRFAYAALLVTILCCVAIVIARCTGMYSSGVHLQLIPLAAGSSWHL